MASTILLFIITVSVTVCNSINEISCKNLSSNNPTDPPATLPPSSQYTTPCSPKQYPELIGSPCIQLRIRLQTENLLPLNTAPDPVSNIAIIGKTIATITGGTVNIPQSPDLDGDDPDDYDPSLVWKLHDECVIDNQKTDLFWPTEPWNPELNASITRHSKKICESSSWASSSSSDCYMKDIGFTITKPFKTPSSIVYMFHLDVLSLYLSHTCVNDYLTVGGAIYLDGNPLAYAKHARVYANSDPSHQMSFESTVSLHPNTSYEIRHDLIGGYPEDCTLEDISFGADARRLLYTLQDTDTPIIQMNTILNAQGTPNACLLGSHLALSDEMQRGVSAMCGDTEQVSVIEEGLFRQHASHGALKNHLYKAGSLHIFDENEMESFFDGTFPQHNVSDPCLTVDEERNIIYAVGGAAPNGSAVHFIQGYQFDDDSLSSGRIMTELDGWVLDKPRYGASCLYWNDGGVGKLVVISGMANTGYEFTNKFHFYRDIRVFPVPDNGFVAPSLPLPIETTKRLIKNVIDSKPLLIDNHVLMLFGGKTHRASKPFVSRFDLNDISNDNAVIVEQMTLTKNVALPLTDVVYVNDTNEIKCCYMIFGGQQYYNFQLKGDIDASYMQLFCNENIDDECERKVSRRRLQDNAFTMHIPTLTEFDWKMLKPVRRRRLSENAQWPTPKPTMMPTPQPTPTEVLVRSYHYGLDGVWYNFTADSEICHSDNDELKDVVDQYERIIASKPNGALWLDYADRISKALLNVSVDVYKGWSDGFGAVTTLDLEILDVHYVDTTQSNGWPTPKPTTPVTQPIEDVVNGLCCACVGRGAHSGGCDLDKECEDVICDFDTFCCLNDWDSTCSKAADAICRGDEGPLCCGSCALYVAKEDGGVAGCVSDQECENKLCSNDPFCCGRDEKNEGYWDHKCAESAWYTCIQVFNNDQVKT
eukprot:920473_1